MRLKNQPAVGGDFATKPARYAKPVILTFALLISAFLTSAPLPSFAYSEASSEAGSEAGSESGGFPGGRRRGRYRRFQQQQQQQQRQMMKQQKQQQRQLVQQQKQNQARIRNQPSPQVQIKEYPSHGKKGSQTNP